MVLSMSCHHSLLLSVEVLGQLALPGCCLLQQAQPCFSNFLVVLAPSANQVVSLAQEACWCFLLILGRVCWRFSPAASSPHDQGQGKLGWEVWPNLPRLIPLSLADRLRTEPFQEEMFQQNFMAEVRNGASPLSFAQGLVSSAAAV